MFMFLKKIKMLWRLVMFKKISLLLSSLLLMAGCSNPALIVDEASKNTITTLHYSRG